MNGSGSTEVSKPVEPNSARAGAEARRHFRTGVKLYRDANYKGALAEFEASYRAKPNASSLQNVALCLKALFRYAQAARSLHWMLERHTEELSKEEREAVAKAIEELRGLTGSLRLQVIPEHAELSVDGRTFARGEVPSRLELNVGEHTITAEAPGYARKAEIVRLASQQELVVQLRLEPTAGFLEITADNPRAAIAIDEQPVGYGHWFGPVKPGVEHVVQVYGEGFEPFEQSVEVELGQTERVRAELGPPPSDVDPRAPLPSLPAAPPRSTISGPYGLAVLSVVGLNDAPLDLKVGPNLALPSFGLRGGYRISESLAVEVAFDIGRLSASDVCQPPAGGAADGTPDSTPNSPAPCEARRNFSLQSLRFGPNLRLSTFGDHVRFVTGIGAGVVRHRLELEAAAAGSSQLAGGKAHGYDPYFSLELGAAFQYRRMLAELGVIAFIEGASDLSGAFDESEKKAVFSNGTLPMLGLVLKLGYSRWSTRR